MTPRASESDWAPSGDGTILAAVLVVDTVDSTRRRVELGERRAEEERRASFAEIHAAVAAHQGIVVEGLGDGALALLPSTSSAIAAGLDLASPSYRIGISTGDVESREGRCHGDAVRVAKALEQACPPGAVACTRLSFDLALTAPQSRLELLGGLTLDGRQIDALALRPQIDNRT